jgi:ATP adenylyltransferase
MINPLNIKRIFMKRLWTPWRMSYIKKEVSEPDSGECLFCRILRSDDDAAEHILYRGERSFVTLNLYPYNNGHLLVVPHQHTGSLEDLKEETLTELMRLAQQSVALLRTAYKPDGFNLGINQGRPAGAGIADHLHLHVVPRWNGDTNYMTVIAETRLIPEWVDDTYAHLRGLWVDLFGDYDDEGDHDEQ